MFFAVLLYNEFSYAVKFIMNAISLDKKIYMTLFEAYMNPYQAWQSHYKKSHLKVIWRWNKYEKNPNIFKNYLKYVFEDKKGCVNSENNVWSKFEVDFWVLYVFGGIFNRFIYI